VSDIIAVSGIRGFGRHGVLPHEGEFGQEFSVDVVIDTDLTAAAAADDLTLTVDYGAVAQLAHGRLVGPPFALIETLADAIAADIAALPGAAQVTVTVHKPHAPMPVGVADVTVTRRRRAPSRVVLGLGSNQGDRLSQLQRAVDELTAQGVRVRQVSPVVATAPVGGPTGQPDFLNAVAVAATDLTPHEVLRVCRRIEDDAERDRSVRWGPRPIDVDILDFGGRRMDEPDLVLPHPRAVDRAFVMVPWSLVAPDDRLGPGGSSVAEIAAGLDAAGVAPAPGAELTVADA
jgi:dihydroneopterin aldolase/2-amino-4-hydroxy-6-hydroxymethyldihydropteridine diphosphokinase